jgi:cytochrome c oxidase subunit 2
LFCEGVELLEGGACGGGGGGGGGNVQQLALSTFKQQGCNSCHTLKAANATGTVGPDLDKLPQYAQQAHQPLAAFVRESIVDPGKYIQPGYSNAMPPIFGNLPKNQLDALVQFLSSQKGG